MHDTGDAKDKSFTVFHSAAEEADTKRENDAMKRQEQSWDNEGGHMSSTGGRVSDEAQRHSGHCVSARGPLDDVSPDG